MKIFISCSSSDEISDEYKIVSKYLINEISKNNDLVFGCANSGLMGLCYNTFLNNKRKIYGVCNEIYIDNLKELDINEIKYAKCLEEANKLLGELSDIILILPGAFGTLCELMDLLEEKRVGIHEKDIIIFNINGYYNELFSMFDKINKKVSKRYDYTKLCKIFTTSDEIIDYVNKKNC